MVSERHSRHSLPLRWSCAIVLVTLVIPYLETLAAANPQPNIILILADDLGYADLGCTGSESYQTPHIDELAKTGMYFSRAYASHSTCLPSRAAILTGKSPARLNIVSHAAELARDEYTLGEALQNADYKTGFIGKWHVGKHGRSGPREQGFDSVVASNYAGQPGSYFFPFKKVGDRRSARFNVPDLESYGPDAFLTECIGAEAVKFIEANENRPFFLYMSHYAVHTPIQAKSEKVEKYRRLIKPDARQSNAEYAALVEHFDEAVGQVLNAVRENGLEDNTIVIFFSDNGGVVNHGITSNAPLRDGKKTFYEGGIRVPLIVRWPGVTQPEEVCQEPVIGHDLYPTILRMAGIDMKNDIEDIDGVDLSPLLRNPMTKLDRDELHWLRYPIPVHFRKEDLATGPSGALIKGDWKLIEFFPINHGTPPRYELFNLSSDPYEKENLSASQPKQVDALKQIMYQWRENIDAPRYDSSRYN